MNCRHKNWIAPVISLVVGPTLVAWTLLSPRAEKSNVLPYFTLTGVVLFFYGVGKGFYLITPVLNARYGSALFIVGIVGLVGCLIAHILIGVVACGFAALIGFGDVVFRSILSKK
jgi:nitrate/nitrite transporter NarK